MTRDISKILKESQVAFEPGDFLIMYTDGITESRNGNKESDLMFGIERLIQVIVDSPIKTAMGVFKHITIELSRFMGYNHRQFDDITLIVIRYKNHVKSAAHEERQIAKENITEWNWNS
jgi:sigma-B regulation protein RsbU (phosphoserine phosphatase)